MPSLIHLLRCPAPLLSRSVSVAVARLSAVVVTVLVFASTARADILTGYQEFYINASEDDMWSAFEYVDSDPVMTGNTHTVISITASTNGTKVYYDHWEDGYDLDPANPETTADEKQTLNAGGVWKCESSDIPHPRGTSGTYYDGMDRIYVAGGAATVTRAFWTEDQGTIFAVSWQIFPVRAALNHYTVPGGEDLAPAPPTGKGYEDFMATSLVVQSMVDGNTVQINDPTLPGIEKTIVLQKGQTTEFHPVRAGTTVEGSGAVHVTVIAGHSQAGAWAECRAYPCLASNLWDNDYYCAVDSSITSMVAGQDDTPPNEIPPIETDLYLHNPNATSILVRYQDTTGSGSFSIPAGGTKSYVDGVGRPVPLNSGVRLWSDDKFWGVGANDTESGGWEWGFCLLPAKFLDTDYFVGWAPGKSPEPATANGSPVFVTPIEDRTTVYVDYSPTNGTIDATYTLNKLQTQRIFDPDNDNSGMHVWATGPISTFWGEDSRASDRGSGLGYLDLGYTCFPNPAEWMDLVLNQTNTVLPTTIAPVAGKTVTFTLTTTTYNYTANTVAVVDTLPANFSFVANSAVITFPNLTTKSGAAANPTIAGQNLTWSNAILNTLNMNPNETLTITFNAITTAGITAGVYQDVAQATGYRLSGVQAFSPQARSYIWGSQLLIDMDAVPYQATVNPGGFATWTVKVSNVATTSATNVQMGCVLPTGFAYRNGSTSLTYSNATPTASPPALVPASGATNCTWGTWTINANGWVQIQFSANVASNASPTTYDFTATATSTQTGTIDDAGLIAQDSNTPDGLDPEDDEDVTVTSMQIDMDTSTPTVNVGGQATYTIRVINPGTAPVTNVTVGNDLPTGFTFVGGSTSVVNTNATRTSTTNPANGATSCAWGTWTINGPGSIAITYQANVTGAAPIGVTQNTATATSTETGPIDDTGNVAQDSNTPPGEDPENDENTTVTKPVLLINCETTTPSLNAGGTATYTITVQNTGTGTATGVTLGDTLPSSGSNYFRFAGNVSITETNATRTGTTDPALNATGTISWGTWTLNAGGSVVLQFNATVDAGMPANTYQSTATAWNVYTGTIDDQGTVAYPADADTLSTDTPDTDEDVTVMRPVLVMNLTTATPAVQAGGEVTYTIEIQNTGNGPAVDVTLGDTLPSSGANYFRFSRNLNISETDATRTGTTDPTAGATGAISWGTWTIDPGGSVILDFIVTVDGGMPQATYQNTATATSPQTGAIDDLATVGYPADLDTLPADTTTDEDVTIIPPPVLTATKTGVVNTSPDNQLARPTAVNGVQDVISYTITITNPVSPGTPQTDITVSNPVPGETTYVAGSSRISGPRRAIRATEYYVTAFGQATYDLTLDRPLAPNYFIIVKGCRNLTNGDSVPRDNYIALTQDPWGTGDLDPSSGSNVLQFTRGSGGGTWVGVITVVESPSSNSTKGFTLRAVSRVAQGGNATTGTATSAYAWPNMTGAYPFTSKIMLVGGYNGAGVNTTSNTTNRHVTCFSRIWPSGTNTINWSRNAGGYTLDAATLTVMVVDWGSEWTVQRARVQGNAGGNGINTTGEYNPGANNLASAVVRANTWVWGTGITNAGYHGTCADAAAITLGDGVNQNANEQRVSVGIEYNNRAVDFEVYALTHSQLSVSHVKKADGDAGNEGTVQTVSVATTNNPTASNRMAIAYNTCNGNTATSFSRPIFSARYTDNATIGLQRQRAGDNFCAWVQGINFFGIYADFTNELAGDLPDLVTLNDRRDLSATQALTITFQARANTPLSDGLYEITSTATIDSNENNPPFIRQATVRVPHLGSYETDYTTGDELYRRDPEATGQGTDPIYTAGQRYRSSTAYDVAYYDALGARVNTHTTPVSSSGGNLQSTFANGSDSIAYGTWTAVTVPDGVTPKATLAAQLADNSTITTDTFEVRSWSKSEFTDSLGNVVTSYSLPGGSDTGYLRVYDRDRNTDPAAIDRIWVTVQDATTGDSESFWLYETGINTGVFANDAGRAGLLTLPLSVYTGYGVNDGTLHTLGDNTLQILYTDPGDTVDQSSAQATVPTLAVIARFQTRLVGGQVLVEWETSAEVGTVGFDLYRLDPVSGEYVKVNDRLLPGLLTSHQGGTYRFVDAGARPGLAATYVLVEREARGDTRRHGPYTLTPGDGGYGSGPQTVGLRSAAASAAPELDAAGTQFERTPRNLVEAQTRSSHGDKPRPGRIDLAEITVRDGGLYFVPAATIANALGVTLRDAGRLLASGNLELQHAGRDVPWLGAAGATGLYFYAQGLSTQYTDEDVYRLSRGRGLSMAYLDGAPAAVRSRTVGTFTETLHVEQDQWYEGTLFEDPTADYWLWDFVFAGYPGYETKSFPFRADGVSGSGAVAMTVRLQSASTTELNPEHQAEVRLNGTLVATDTWAGIAARELTFAVTPTLLQDGANTLELTGLLPPDVPYSIVYLDSFDVTYERTFAAADDALLLRTAQQNQAVTVTGFSNRLVWVFNVTDPENPAVLAGARVKADERGSYAVSFQGAAVGSRYLALALSTARAPVSVLGAMDPKRIASDLLARDVRANYVVITPISMRDTAQTLATYRQSRGYRTLVVTLEDIMDVFSNGTYNPEAIRDFLVYARDRWRVPPAYVVLAGKGTYDYRNLQAYGDNLIPALLTGTPDGLFASDALYAGATGRGGSTPEMAIGRLPAKNATELAAMIAKIVAYEAANPAGWTNRAIMLADDPDDGGDFTADSLALGQLLPGGCAPSFIHLADLTTEAARTQLLAGLNDGALLLNYFGHGGLDRFAEEGLLLDSDAAGLGNGSRLPVVAGMTCLTGHFEMPGVVTLSEALLLQPGGGAVAVWSPSGLSVDSDARVLDEALFRAVFSHGETRLGDAIRQAGDEYRATRGVDPGLPAIYNLLGDPALRLHTAGAK